ncbi:tryparedoxin-like protein [Leptomonas pyrrhocoris]|uniref:Tryparedoxin-like protein n=1 Tax=Leptomonas pyrrhocoris TaxID=157538 RepID=A0A0M9G1R6_LEPPY|nr:tryparedoxin-like protein [Leptomonas pyrrhocoris]KPA80473.1 tryparedoxin-like protein [Leptomonas pyrrhocoris]|eukprot:XP_015658912.1 tryparedoxin-like protein [Leptomonas pyrrhocoris]
MPLGHRDVPFLSHFPDLQLLRQDGSTVPASKAFEGKKYVLIYFSAHWCPPCQRFTPLLADFYDEHKDKYGFEVLFVSSDREEGRMMDFFQNRSSNYVRRPPPLDSNGDTNTSSNGPAAVSATAALPEPLPGDNCTLMGCDIASCSKKTTPSCSPLVNATAELNDFPLDNLKLRTATGVTRTPKANGHGNWLALPFKETDVARSLARAYSVVSIPKLVVVAVDTSCTVTREGKAMVLKDPEAKNFPWRFAEGSMGRRPDGKRECILLVFLLIVGVYYYIWGF